jgi:hypothetical protein
MLRKCRTNKDRHASDSLAKKLLANNSKAFWDEVKKLGTPNVTTQATIVGGATGSSNICNMWRDHYKKLLNSSKDVSKKASVMYTLDCTENYNHIPFMPLEVKEAIHKLKKGKSVGMDTLNSEHFIYASDKIYVYLCILFNTMLCHGYVPSKLMDTMLISLVKDKKGNVTDSDNYRPIALTCAASKIFEILILYKYSAYLKTGDQQFGFKELHSTDLCVFVLKEVVSFYSNLSSPVYACFIDASKAFDRVNHWLLFDKLLQRGLPKIVVRILMVWYTTQTFIVKWDNVISTSFHVLNGVRQGGVLSPVLFNIFVEDLSAKLSAAKVGCYINGVCYNHLNYADDCVLLAPSVRALQILIDECVIFSQCNDMLYNCKKSLCMSFYPKVFCNMQMPTVYLGDQPLKWVKEHKYIGVVISGDRTDDADINRQIKAFYARGNMLIRKFKKCSVQVKAQLFKSYCSNIYAGHLWSKYSASCNRKIKVAYNSIFRVLMDLKRDCSMSSSYVEYSVHSFSGLLRVYINGFIERLEKSCNSLVSTLCNTTYFMYTSDLFKMWKDKVYIL